MIDLCASWGVKVEAGNGAGDTGKVEAGGGGGDCRRLGCDWGRGEGAGVGVDGRRVTGGGEGAGACADVAERVTPVKWRLATEEGTVDDWAVIGDVVKVLVPVLMTVLAVETGTGTGGLAERQCRGRQQTKWRRRVGGSDCCTRLRRSVLSESRCCRRRSPSIRPPSSRSRSLGDVIAVDLPLSLSRRSDRSSRPSLTFLSEATSAYHFCCRQGVSLPPRLPRTRVGFPPPSSCYLFVSYRCQGTSKQSPWTVSQSNHLPSGLVDLLRSLVPVLHPKQQKIHWLVSWWCFLCFVDVHILAEVTRQENSMGSDFQAIPIIDVGPLLSKCDNPSMFEDRGVLKVVRQLDEACRETGFFYVKGHGIPDSLVKEVKDLTRKFFDLPYEEKAKIKMSPATGYRGYQRIGENITLGKPDMHEAIDCYRPMKAGEYGSLGKTMEGENLWPNCPSNFKSSMEEYINLLKELARKIMQGIALALGGPPETFEGEIAGDTFWVMRIIGYPGLPAEIQFNDVGCEAHTDYGLLTLVNQDDDVHALQVRNRAGEWICAVPIPGTFVCNIGDMLKVWSNGLYEPTLHRVVNNSPKYRVSVVFFYEPNFDTAAEPLEFCKEKTSGTVKHQRVVYGEHLVGKVTTNFAS
ncbi:hypothetical protein HPP92_015821 [Vanilla planifolia]|uniref:Fe2OG dioxygenase domain-containing protein n=1 Tax=Vanilla planifolia TaxID=51239 RepID=A0A835USD9_VANPL|nr:hypothetical protein HPP92_015821 [Vanilla planifolia]